MVVDETVSGELAVPGLHEDDAASELGAGEEPDEVATERAVPVPRSSTADDAGATARAADPVRAYLDGVGRTPLLTAEQEVDLARRMEAGLYAASLLDADADAGRVMDPHRRSALEAVAADGEAARATMVQANLRLVVSIAKRYSHLGMPFLDIVQEGNLGLIHAVAKFDWSKGFKFSTYATWWIRQGIQRGFVENSRAVRLPTKVIERLGKVASTQRRLEAQTGQRPTDAEVAAELGCTEEAVVELRSLARTPVSLDRPVGDDSADAVLGDLLHDETDVPVEDLVSVQADLASLRSLVTALDPVAAEVVRLRFGLDDGTPRTFAEIGAVLGMSRERTRLMEKAALADLRERLGDPDGGDSLQLAS